MHTFPLQYLHAYLKWKIMGITGIHAIPVIITCTLQGALCDTGIPCTFYGEKICSVSILEKSSFWKKNLETPWKKIPILKYEKINEYKIRQIFGQKLARSLLKPIFELTPYKGPWIVVCLLNGPLSQDLASKNSYLVYHVIFLPLKLTIFFKKN